MNNDLVVRYNNLKGKVQDLENRKIQLSTSIEIKEVELAGVREELVALGVTDFSDLEGFISSKREEFNNILVDLEAKLDGSVRTGQE